MKTGSGCKLYIGTTQAASNQTEFESDTYTEVGEISEIGAFGDTRNVVTFATLADGRMQKARGVADAGNAVITYAHATGDQGQDALKAAYDVTSQAADEFNFKVELNDQITPSTGNPTTIYFRAKVTGRQVQSITSDGVVTVQATLAINSAVLEVEAA